MRPPWPELCRRVIDLDHARAAGLHNQEVQDGEIAGYLVGYQIT